MYFCSIPIAKARLRDQLESLSEKKVVPINQRQFKRRVFFLCEKIISNISKITVIKKSI